MRIPVKIVPGATLREEDGLAMSSRNLRLDASQRESAKEIYAIITNWIQSQAYIDHSSSGENWAN